MFRKLLEDEIKRRKLSARDAALQIGVSHTTVYQILNGRGVDIDTANKVCKWLGVTAEAIFDEPAHNDTTAAMVSMILRSFPELAAVFNQCAEEVTKGNMTDEDFQAVIEFAAFQIQKRRGIAVKNVGEKNTV